MVRGKVGGRGGERKDDSEGGCKGVREGGIVRGRKGGKEGWCVEEGLHEGG